MSASKIAFFGATGDSAGHCLAYTLNAGYDCVALARTPAKLTQSMKDKNVSASALDQHLTIIQGDVKDVSAVKSALQINGIVVDTIVSGIGLPPIFNWSFRTPFTIADPDICKGAGATILQALEQLKPARKPFLINISTTGIPPKGKPRDVPLAYLFLYPYFGHVMHEDKRILEANLAAHVRLPEGQRGIRGFVNVKPSLLMDGEGKGLDAIRQGVDEEPAVGYSIQRKDVGLWMFTNLLEADVKSGWVNKSVSLTY